jgi:hypothetical protein
LGIEWYKILPTHSKIVFNKAGVTLGEDSLTAYLRLATDMITNIGIKVSVDPNGQTFTLQSKDGENQFSFNSAEGLSELGKIFGSGFNFTSFAGFANIDEFGSLLDSISENYEKVDSAKWVNDMNELLKKLGRDHQTSEKTKKEK